MMMKALSTLTTAVGNALFRHNRTFFAPMSFINREFAVKRTTTRRSIKKSAPPPSTPATVDEAWEPVTDPATGGIYFWNTMTNEVTHVGAAHPVLAAQQAQQGQSGGIMQPQTQGGGMMSGLGGVVAQGMAFGVGSSIAHHAVGSMMGHGGGGHHEAPPQDTGGDFDGDFDL